MVKKFLPFGKDKNFYNYQYKFFQQASRDSNFIKLLYFCGLNVEQSGFNSFFLQLLYLCTVSNHLIFLSSGKIYKNKPIIDFNTHGSKSNQLSGCLTRIPLSLTRKIVKQKIMWCSYVKGFSHSRDRTLHYFTKFFNIVFSLCRKNFKIQYIDYTRVCYLRACNFIKE